MSDALMASKDREEALSLVYVQAVAAKAGYTTSSRSPDRDGVDVQIQAGGGMRPVLDLQLKATVNLKKRGNGSVRYPLNVHNYDLLRIHTWIPRLLVVLDLPKNEERWMTVTERKLILRRRAYWLNLRGRAKTRNKFSVTVEIPGENLFDVNSLVDLMKQSREGGIR